MLRKARDLLLQRLHLKRSSSDLFEKISWLHKCHGILSGVLVAPQDPSTPKDVRIAEGLGEIGPSVVVGAGTTFIGIMPMAFARNHVFRVFFKMFIIIIGFGVRPRTLRKSEASAWTAFS